MSSQIVPAHFDEFCHELLQLLPRVRSFALSYCGSTADADDMVQLTCERALKRWRQWTGDGPLERWLFKILVNLLRDEKRSRRARAGQAVASTDDLVSEAATPEASLYLDQVHAEIMRLPEGQRAVLLLVAGEGFSYRETAQLLDIPIGTVMSRLARARGALLNLVR